MNSNTKFGTNNAFNDHPKLVKIFGQDWSLYKIYENVESRCCDKVGFVPSTNKRIVYMYGARLGDLMWSL